MLFRSNIKLTLHADNAITANGYFQNQSMLAYQAQPTGSMDDSFIRDYMGGSHSNAVQTIDGMPIKSVTPLTTTLGGYITFTISIPSPTISATMKNVVVTDTIDNNFAIDNAFVNGGYGGVATYTGQLVTATISSITHATQADVIIVAYVANTSTVEHGSVMTNIATMRHDNLDENSITTTNKIGRAHV